MTEVKYLDNGFVRLVNVSMDDQAVVDAARLSYAGTSYQDVSRNQGLINYLIEHKHSSPFEMPHLTFHLKMPIFIMRQHVRHRVANLNEKSGRYSEFEKDYYLPDVSRFKKSHKTNKQGSGGQIPLEDAKKAQSIMYQVAETEWQAYQDLLQLGVSRETARGVLNVNYYTEVVWQMDLRNLFHYLKLRNDSHAQEEIQEMAQIIEDIVAEHYPMCYSAWQEFDKGSVSFSRSEIKELRQLIESYEVDEKGRDSYEEEMGAYLSQPLNGSVRRRKDFARKIGLVGEDDDN